ncbi:MAG: YiiX family permuted papain-like enzyme [Bacteroidia bacterium]|nr:YiiX family permuted papain-like enzyme [Bacteroidia bacterium]
MKYFKFAIYSLLVILISCSNPTEKTENIVGINKSTEKQEISSKLKDGDIIFQSSSSGQSQAIQIATKSKYSHVGIIYIQNNEIKVLEAVQPVQLTNLEKWIDRGDNNHYVVKRLKNAETVLTPEIISKMKELGNSFLGKNYDITFEWSDENMYCSELVWKLYKRITDIEIGKLDKLKNFELSHPIVQKKMNERYGNKIPYEENVISPAAIFNSDKLFTIKEEN